MAWVPNQRLSSTIFVSITGTQVFIIEPVHDAGIVVRLKDTSLRMRSGAIELTLTAEQAVDRI